MSIELRCSGSNSFMCISKKNPLFREVRDLRQTVSEMTSKMKEMLGRMAEQSEELEKKEEVLGALQLENLALKSKGKRDFRQISRKDATIAQLRKSCKRLKTEHETTLAGHKYLKQLKDGNFIELEQLNEKLKENKKQLKIQKNENQHLNDILEGYEGGFKGYNKEIADLRREKEDFKAAFERGDRIIQDQRETLLSLRNTNLELEKECWEHAEEKSASEAQIISLRCMVLDLEREISQLNEQLPKEGSDSEVDTLLFFTE